MAKHAGGLVYAWYALISLHHPSTLKNHDLGSTSMGTLNIDKIVYLKEDKQNVTKEPKGRCGVLQEYPSRAIPS